MRRWLALVLVGLGCSSSSTTSEPPPVVEPTVAPPPALGMNDVSVLWPLPSSPAAPGYLTPQIAGARGPLLPKAVFDEIPAFPVEVADGLDHARMRVVSLRFDGCFPGKSGCEAQIRLVMQPIDDDGAARDSALHLFYALTEEELPAVVTALRQLRALAPEVADAPLDVHAAIVAQGADGPYATGLRDLVLTYAGEQNLTRMTFFLRAPPTNEVWFFGGFDRQGGALTPLDIVGVGKSNQRVILTETPGGHDYDFTPPETKPEVTLPLLSSEKAKVAPRADIEKTLAAFLRIENPAKFGPDQLPCAGCHVSTVVTSFAREQLKLSEAAIPDAFTSKRDLTLRGDAAKTPSSLRAFGWFGKRPMISRRVLNESAHVVDDLEARFPATP